MQCLKGPSYDDDFKAVVLATVEKLILRNGNYPNKQQQKQMIKSSHHVVLFDILSDNTKGKQLKVLASLVLAALTIGYFCCALFNGCFSVLFYRLISKKLKNDFL